MRCDLFAQALDEGAGRTRWGGQDAKANTHRGSFWDGRFGATIVWCEDGHSSMHRSPNQRAGNDGYANAIRLTNEPASTRSPLGRRVTTFLIAGMEADCRTYPVPILAFMSIVANRGTPATSLRSCDALWAIVISLVCLIALYRDTVAQITSLWASSGTYEHGFAIAPIVAWLIWNRRHELSQYPAAPSILALGGVIAAGFLWLLGVLALANVVTYFALVSMIVATIVAIAGLRVARLLIFPLGFLFLAVPFGDFMVPIMMDWTANFTVSALRLTGAPVFREGNDFVIPTGRWSVVEACSGVRYFHAALTGGALFAYLFYRSTPRRVAFIGLSIVTPIIANWLRAYLIVLTGHLSNNELASGVDHLVYGWVFFGIVMALLFWLGIRWREDQPRQIAVGVDSSPSVQRLGRQSLLAVTVAAMVSALIWPVMSNSIQARLDAFVPSFTIESVRPSNWQTMMIDSPSWQPILPGAKTVSRKTFASGQDRAGIHIAWFYGERDKSKLVSALNTMTDRAGPWRVIERGNATMLWRGEQRSPCCIAAQARLFHATAFCGCCVTTDRYTSTARL
ncbi:MAG: exosortase A [Betaproteobacteria bacterium]|nr:exosortase A [Betaproteobacteria bacterium]